MLPNVLQVGLSDIDPGGAGRPDATVVKDLVTRRAVRAVGDVIIAVIIDPHAARSDIEILGAGVPVGPCLCMYSQKSSW